MRRARAQREQERAEAASRAVREGQAERERTERPRAEHAPADRLPADPPPGDAPPADRHPADRPPPLAPGLAPAGPLSPVPAVRSPAPVAPTRPQLRRPPAVDEAGEAVASWSQQVHRLARGGEPEQPPAEEPFARAARERARVRPAGLGRRFTARLVDSALLGALVAAVAVPVGLRTLQHVDHKIEAARHSGRTVTVWLVDGTTGAHLAVVLGALLIFGFVYEVLPTAWWGRTVGKQLCGVTVLDMGSQRLPSFGASLRRWLTHTLLGLIAIGALGVLWALFDHPWRQCWHDKAARTFVAVRRPSPRGA
ncbi:conserved hypothetical protein [Streptomyces clavuligerus]|nr:conserved hypothetical protein [Streptomyces clavuligerus]